MGNQITRALKSFTDVQYDENAKNILSNRYVLAWILKYTTAEFAELSIRQISNECIGQSIEVTKIPVFPEGKQRHIPEKILGENTESVIPGEGKVMFDIRFSAFVPKEKGSIKILLNLEAQREFHTGYSLVTRGIFYAARMMSAQLDTEFSSPNYRSIKKCVSIWLAMNGPNYIGNAISEYALQKHDIINGIPDIKENYDKLSVILICLNTKNQDNGNNLTRFLSTLMSTEITVAEKKKILAEKYEINTDTKMEEEMEKMCNLSQAIREDGREEGREESKRSIIINMLKRGMHDEDICALTECSKELLDEIKLSQD